MIRRPSRRAVIGGDVHAFVAADLKTDFDDPKSPVIATEFVGGAITSQGAPQARTDAVLPDNPHIRYANSEKQGYALVDLLPKRAEIAFRAVDNVKRKDSGTALPQRFTVEDGKAGFG